jgi:hypothetical protein
MVTGDLESQNSNDGGVILEGQFAGQFDGFRHCRWFYACVIDSTYNSTELV